MDINQIQARLDKLTAPKGQKFEKIDRTLTFFKPGLGKHLVRFVPYKENPENPFVELYFHYNIGPKVMLSPISYGEKDPIVEFANTLSKSKDPEDWKLAKKLKPKMRTFALVIDRKEEEKGPRWFDFGKTVYQSLLALAADEEVGDFTDILQGRDIKVDVVAGANYNETSVMPAMKLTPLSKNNELVEKWLNEQPELISNYKKYSFDEIKGFLEKWLNPEENNEEETVQEKPILNNAFEIKDHKPSTPVKKKEVITESEFDDLFNED
jgi:hypothetical protein